MKIRYPGIVVVAAAIGLWAFFVIRNQPGDSQIGRQNREGGELQAMESGWWFSRILDEVGPAAAIAVTESSPPGSLGGTGEISADYEGFETYYTEELDPWGNPCEVSSGSNLIGYKVVIQIRCFGRDGKEGPTKIPYPLGPFVTTAYDEDIVWADGFFVRYAAGAPGD